MRCFIIAFSRSSSSVLSLVRVYLLSLKLVDINIYEDLLLSLEIFELNRTFETFIKCRHDRIRILMWIVLNVDYTYSIAYPTIIIINLFGVR